MIWHAQYIYFRRYSLDDRPSFLLNAALLFVVAFYIYPLRQLSSPAAREPAHRLRRDGERRAAAPGMTRVAECGGRGLMLIYGAGFIGLYVIFALLYLPRVPGCATRSSSSPMEVYETRGVVQENLLMIGIGTLALSLAFFNLPQFSGLSYALIGPLQTWLGSVHGKGRRRFSESPEVVS